jgi:anthranilate/para-aminobenzoate synthase component I
MLARVCIDAPPDPLAIAAALAGRPGVVALCDGVGRGWSPSGRWSFVACDPDAASAALDPWSGAEPEATDDPLRGLLPRWVGAIPYEACRARLERPSWSRPDVRPPASATAVHWWRYPAVVAIDHAAGRVLAVAARDADADALAALTRASLATGAEASRRSRAGRAPAPAIRVVDGEPPAAHVERVRAALELIRAGDLYQVNLARRLRLVAEPMFDAHAAVALARRLFAAAPAPFGAIVTTPEAIAISTSPELLLDARPGPEGARFGALRTDPIKGTRPRGVGLARELDHDPKERAELAMILDVERNDLGRVARPGSVAVDRPRVVRAGRVLHRLAAVRATARPDLSGDEVLASIVPSGSVTGAPKVRAMEVIAALEPARRGLYTGGFGVVTHDGAVRLAMAIRTAVVPARSVGAPGDDAASEGEWLVGGGIVEASDPDRELEETRWKSRQLEALVGAGSPRGHHDTATM